MARAQRRFGRGLNRIAQMIAHRFFFINDFFERNTGFLCVGIPFAFDNTLVRVAIFSCRARRKSAGKVICFNIL